MSQLLALLLSLFFSAPAPAPCDVDTAQEDPACEEDIRRAHGHELVHTELGVLDISNGF